MHFTSWASWQGHLDIMKFLHEKGANVKSTNSFGCNAVLWSAQSTQSGCGVDAIQYLQNIGCEVGLMNSNGHGILHKAGQRGKKDVCEWVFQKVKDGKERIISSDILCNSKGHLVDVLRLISPDAENCCPSDLAGMSSFVLSSVKSYSSFQYELTQHLAIGFEGMEGHIEIAQWLVEQERKVCLEYYLCTENRDIVPNWLQDGLSNVKHLVNRSGLEGLWESGAAVKKIAHFVDNETRRMRESEISNIGNDE